MCLAIARASASCPPEASPRSQKCRDGDGPTVTALPTPLQPQRTALLRSETKSDHPAPMGTRSSSSYDRKVLKQTGSGHFSPIGAYDPVSDRVLILDVARFKYPPHWVKLDLLREAMRSLDSATKLPRGWVALAKKPQVPMLVKCAPLRASCGCVHKLVQRAAQAVNASDGALQMRNIVRALFDSTCCSLKCSRWFCARAPQNGCRGSSRPVEIGAPCSCGTVARRSYLRRGEPAVRR